MTKVQYWSTEIVVVTVQTDQLEREVFMSYTIRNLLQGRHDVLHIQEIMKVPVWVSMHELCTIISNTGNKNYIYRKKENTTSSKPRFWCWINFPMTSPSLTYQCFYIHSRDGVCVVFGLWQLCAAQQLFQCQGSHNLLDLAAKSGDILWTVSATTKFIPTVFARGIVELENTKEAVNQCIPSLSFDVKKITDAQA